MLFSTSITEMEDFFLIAMTGPVDGNKVGAVQAYLYSDESYLRKPKVIWDFTAAVTDMSGDDMEKLAKLTQINRQFNDEGRTAIVIKELDKNIALIQKFIEETKEMVVDFELFYSLENAVFWITM